jgi:hypothetical protein
MPEYTVSFAGLHVAIQYDDVEVYQFLSLLFEDLHGESEVEQEVVLCIKQTECVGEYTLSTPGCAPFTGALGVRFAAVLFDDVIFNLLNNNSHGIAFHAGAVAYKGKVILLPGLSGYGKSSMTACLVTHGFSYLTDELYFVPAEKQSPGLPFTRPLCIKSGATAAIRQLVSKEVLDGAIGDKYGYVIPHRLLNPNFQATSTPPSLILIPKYCAEAVLDIEKISAAQVSTHLMACDVNGRNLEDHGFRQVVQIAKSIPTYRITYSSFQGVHDAIRSLFDNLHWT